MIYRAEDKSNGRLNRRAMRRFAPFLNEQLLSELFLQGCSHGPVNGSSPLLRGLIGPSPRRIGLMAIPITACVPSPRTAQTTLLCRFETIWTRFDGFMQVVCDAWVCPLQNADAFRVLDHRLRNTAKALKSWSMKNIGSIKLQLYSC